MHSTSTRKTTGAGRRVITTLAAFGALLPLCLVLASEAPAQTRTVGLFQNDSRAYPGYTLFSPKHNTMTYLIDNAGRVVHSWTKSTSEPGQSCVLTEDGHLMRAAWVKGQLSTGGGEGGRIEEYDWDGNLVWQLDWSTATYMQHHDFRILPNGNVLLLVVEKKTVAEALAAGFNPSSFQAEITTNGYLLPDAVVEIQPTRPVGGKVVWEWHVWDHLIQDFSSLRSNYGVVAAHPERIDPAGDGRQIPAFWNHMNAIYYNALLDQIILSVRGNSEAWVIDHSTTTAEAASGSGGKRGKGGDLLYRWGNPITYRAGTTSDEMLFQQHDARWVDADCPGAGNMMAFNNGVGRNYSTIDEWTPPVDSAGNYAKVSGVAFAPKTFTWSYKATPPASLYSEAISSAQRLPNGNTLICDGTHGAFLEVTSTGETVWRYVSPVVTAGPLAVGAAIPLDPVRPAELLNAVFRVQRYPLTYAGLASRDLTPTARIEIDPRPFAAFTATPSAPNVGDIVTFKDGSGNQPTSWSWSFGDGGTSAQESPTHVYASAGTYTVTLTATNASGSDTTSSTVTVASSGGTTAVRFLPIVLDVTGQAHYASELSLANRGTTDSTVTLLYTSASAFGGLGSGSATLSLPAGHQVVQSDAIAFLRTLGLSIPSGNQGGSLRVTFTGLSSEGAGFASVRITAPAENGRAGVAYVAPSVEALPSSATSWLYGLRSSSQDRTNVAFANAANASSITLRLTLFDGDASGSKLVLPDVTLAAGQGSQLNDVLLGTGFSQAYASISVISGSGPYFAYAVINDQVTNDGSFVSFEVEPSPTEPRLLPVVVETGTYSSEVVLTNRSASSQSVQLSYVESLSPSQGAGGVATESLAPGEQKVISSILDELRLKASGSIGPKGGSYAGTLSARFLASGSLAAGYVGARTGSPSRISAGRYGLFYAGVGTSSRASAASWVFGLRQDSAVRSNVAASASPENSTSISVQAEIYDGSTGKLAGTTGSVTLAPGGWTQWSGLLAAYGVSQGYVRVLNRSSSGTFAAYGVVNDGPTPGSATGTDDGSFLLGVPAGGN